MNLLEKQKLKKINKKYSELKELLRVCNHEIYLNSDYWNWLCEEKCKVSKYKCDLCSERGTKIHLKTTKVCGEESLSDLLCLCDKCYNEINKKGISEFNK